MAEEAQPGGVEVPDETPISQTDFFEKTPPNTWRRVSVQMSKQQGYQERYVFTTPKLNLFCTHEHCNGFRFFKADADELILGAQKNRYVNTYLLYLCQNCNATTKTYAIRIDSLGVSSLVKMIKYGEAPEFGPSTPSRVVKLIGPDKVLFDKGRRCENQGLGVGAFAYYRQVVEHQKDRIFSEISRVSEKIGAPAELIEQLKTAQTERQFTKAIEAIKHGIPQVLMINGHNPLTLLHSALSEGLHNQSDADCLSLATSIRIVLSDLAERLAQAVKDEAELNQAVSKLLAVKAKKAGG